MESHPPPPPPPIAHIAGWTANLTGWTVKGASVYAAAQKYKTWDAAAINCMKDQTATAIVLEEGYYRCRAKTMLFRAPGVVSWLRKSAWPKDPLKTSVFFRHAPKAQTVATHHAGAKKQQATSSSQGSSAAHGAANYGLRPLVNASHFTLLVSHLGLKDPEHLRNSTIVPREAVTILLNALAASGAPARCRLGTRPPSFALLVQKADSCLRWRQDELSSRNTTSQLGSANLSVLTRASKEPAPTGLRSIVFDSTHFAKLIAHLGLNSTEDLRNSTLVPRQALLDVIAQRKADGGPKCTVNEKKVDSFRALVMKADGCLVWRQANGPAATGSADAKSLRNIEFDVSKVTALVAHLGLKSAADLRDTDLVPKAAIAKVIKESKVKGKKCSANVRNQESFKALVLKAEACLRASQDAIVGGAGK